MKKIFLIQPVEFKRKSCKNMDLSAFFIKKVLDKRFGACLNHSRFEMITKSKVNL